MARRQRYTVLVTTPLGGDGVAVESFTLLVDATLRELGHLLYTTAKKAGETLAAQRAEVRGAVVRKRAVSAEVEAKRAVREAKRAEREAKRAEREARRKAREGVKAAAVERKERRVWLKGTPERGDFVLYQEKPHGRWHEGVVVSRITDADESMHIKVSGERGLHIYPRERVKRSSKAPRPRR